MVSVEFFDVESFDELQSYWQCMETGRDMTAFQCFAWYKMINEQQRLKANLIPGKTVYAVAYADGVAQMIAPIHILKTPKFFTKLNLSPGAYILGKWGYTDYLNFIYFDFSEECFNKIIKDVKEKYKVSNFFLHQIYPKTDIFYYIENKYPEAKLFLGDCAKIEVKESFDEYHSNLSKSVRQNIRTAFNRAKNDNCEIRYEIKRQMSEMEAEEFFEIYLERQREKNENSLSFFRKIIFDIQTGLRKYSNKKYNFLLECLKGNNSVFTIGFYTGEKKVGFCLVAEDTEAYRVPVICFKKEYSRYSPGIISIFSFIKESYEKRTIKDFDLLKGTEKYKIDLGAKVFSIGYFKI